MRRAPTRPAPTSWCGRSSASTPCATGRPTGSRACTPRRRRGITLDRVPAAAAQPLHLEQALPPRLLGRPGPVVPRGRRLRGPADHHPAARPGRVDRRAPRRRLPLPAARRQQLHQPADRHRRRTSGPASRPGRSAASCCAGGCRRALYDGVAGHPLRRPLPLVPHQHGHGRRRLLGRAGGGRPRLHRRGAPQWVWDQTAARQAGADRADPLRTAGPTPRSSSAGAPRTLGQWPSRVRERGVLLQLPVPRRPRPRRRPVPAPARAAASSPTPSRTIALGRAADGAGGCSALRLGLPAPRSTCRTSRPSPSCCCAASRPARSVVFPATERPGSAFPPPRRRRVVRLLAGHLRRRGPADRRPRRAAAGDVWRAWLRVTVGHVTVDPSADAGAAQQRRRR